VGDWAIQKRQDLLYIPPNQPISSKIYRLINGSDIFWKVKEVWGRVRWVERFPLAEFLVGSEG